MSQGADFCGFLAGKSVDKFKLIDGLEFVQLGTFSNARYVYVCSVPPRGVCATRMNASALEFVQLGTDAHTKTRAPDAARKKGAGKERKEKAAKGVGANPFAALEDGEQRVMSARDLQELALAGGDEAGDGRC